MPRKKPRSKPPVTISWEIEGRKFLFWRRAPTKHVLTLSEEGIVYDHRPLIPWADVWSVDSGKEFIRIKMKHINHQSRSIGMSTYFGFQVPPEMDVAAIRRKIDSAQKRYYDFPDLTGYKRKK